MIRLKKVPGDRVYPDNMMKTARHSFIYSLVAVVTSVSLVTLALTAASQSPWKLERSTSDGISIYSRGVPDATVREVKANFTVDAPPAVVLEAAIDPESYRETTRKYVVENHTYASGNPNEWFNYQRVNYPFIAHRDYCLRYVRHLNEKRRVYRLTWTTSDRFGPAPRDGIVRVTLVEGRIDIQPINDGKASRVRYQLLADPGGNIPVWVSNMANRNSLADIMRQIRDAALARNSAQP